MKFFEPQEYLPVDGNHRWLAVQPDRPLTTAEITKLGNHAGLYVGAVSKVELEKGTTYVVPVEAEFTGLTPAFVSQKFGAPKLVVTRETVDLMIEQYSDFSEAIEGQKPFPAAFFGPADRVPQDGQWHFTIVSWLDPLSAKLPQAIDDTFKGLGFDTAYTKGDREVTQPGDTMFYVKALKAVPTISELREALGADMVNISVWPSRADIDFIERWEETTGELTEKVKDVAAGLTKFASGTATAAGDALSALGFIGKIAVPLAVGVGSYLAYRWVRATESKS